MRTANITRKTGETFVKADITLDGVGLGDFSTGLPFFDHMIQQLSKHSLIDMNIQCNGDIEIDAHHTVEDLGWALGEAINKAIALSDTVSEKEQAYISALSSRYDGDPESNRDPLDIAYANAMEKLSKNFPAKFLAVESISLDAS